MLAARMVFSSMIWSISAHSIRLHNAIICLAALIPTTIVMPMQNHAANATDDTDASYVAWTVVAELGVALFVAHIRQHNAIIAVVGVIVFRCVANVAYM